MDIVVSKDEIKEYEKLKVVAETTLTKEKLELFEKKHQCTFKEFEKKVRGGEIQENFQEWDDYIEWKAYEESLRNLQQRSKAIDDARNIKVA
jgi:hypothetical protein